MSISSSTSGSISSSTVFSSQVSQAGNTTASQGAVVAPVQAQDRDGSGYIDIEVDYDEHPGTHFSRLGNQEYKPLNAAQRKVLEAQMGDIRSDFKIKFHEKGSYANPDAKVKFGTFKKNDTRNNLVVGYPSISRDTATEVYIRSNPGNPRDNDVLAPTSLNRGGNLLARALLYSLGVPARAPEADEPYSKGYSVHSNVSETTTGQDYKNHSVTLPQINDFKRLAAKYSSNTDGDNIYNLERLGNGSSPVTMVIGDTGGYDALDASGDTHDQVIGLHPGERSSVGGFKGNVTLSDHTIIEDVMTGSGTNTVMPNARINMVKLGPGSNTVLYKHDWDSTPHALDNIVGFKTGVDKLDLSELPWATGMDQYIEAGHPIADIITVDGKDYVRRWNRRGLTTNRGNPEFMVRVDGIQNSDVIMHKNGSTIG